MKRVRWAVSPKIVVEAEGATTAEVFEELAGLVEVFGADNKCGHCGNDALRPVVREVDKNKHYELHCTNAKCRARFVFGQHKEPKGSLFPQRRTGKGDKATFKPNNGWEKYDPNAKKEE